MKFHLLNQIKIRTFATRNRRGRLSENDRLRVPKNKKNKFWKSGKVFYLCRPKRKGAWESERSKRESFTEWVNQEEAKAILADRNDKSGELITKDYIADLRQWSEKVLLRNRKSCRVTTQTRRSCKAETRERCYDNKKVRYCIKI